MDIEGHDSDGLVAANAWLRERRARRLEQPPRHRRRAAIVLVALLHLALLLALRAGMQVRLYAPAPDSRPLVIRFDDASPARTDPALAVAPPVPAPRSESPLARPRDAAPVATPRRPPAREAAAPPPMQMRLFAPDGSLRLSREVIDAARPKPAPTPLYRERARETDVWRADRPAVVYAPTRLERYWKPDKENLAQELVRKYPLLGLVLQNPGGADRCPPRSLDPDCEGAVDPAFAEDPYPDEELLR